MSWVTEWSALSNRIQGMIDAAHFHFLTVRDPRTENHAVFLHVLKPHSEEIYNAIQTYLDTYRSSLSSAEIDSIQRFNKAWSNLLREASWTKLSDIQSAMALLASFKSEFSFHMADVQAISRRLTERAFVHLQRSIVADPTMARS